MSNAGHSMGSSGGAVANAKRRAMAARNELVAEQALAEGNIRYPLPAPVKRQALVAPFTFVVEPSRIALARRQGG